MLKIEEFCFSDCAIRSICIPASLTKIGISCFLAVRFHCMTVESVMFDDGSLLDRFSDSCFKRCDVHSIVIPRRVEILGNSCFERTRIDRLSFQAGSTLSVIGDECFAEARLPELLIPRSVEIMGRQAFAGAVIAGLQFEGGSRLKEIRELCFCRCETSDISFPRGVEVIGGRCLAEARVARVWFEGDPPITVKRSGMMTVRIPRGVKELAPDAFPPAWCIKREA
jgi:hypothetical protein